MGAAPPDYFQIIDVLKKKKAFLIEVISVCGYYKYIIIYEDLWIIWNLELELLILISPCFLVHTYINLGCWYVVKASLHCPESKFLIILKHDVFNYTCISNTKFCFLRI